MQIANKLYDDMMTNHIISKPNRRKVLAPKQGEFWCIACDAQLVYYRKRCVYCGHKNNK